MRNSLAVLLFEAPAAGGDALIHELETGGWQVASRCVGSLDELHEALDRRAWNVVLAACRRLPREADPALAVVQGWNADVPFIIVAPSVDEEQAVTALKSGAYDIVRRDHLARLVPVVERALREAEERRVRRQAEEALRASEERYRELVENANDAVFTIDLSGAFTSFNAAGEQISGYSREQLRTMNMAEVLTPSSYEQAMQMIRLKLQEDRPTVYELTLIAADGHEVPLEVSTRLIYHHARPVGVQGIARDITERRLAEEELRSRERKQAAVAQLGQDALAITDLAVLFDDTVRTVAATLDLEYCSILELLKDGTVLRSRAGVGWRRGLIGRGTVGVGPKSQAGYTLLSSEPVIMDDLRTEQRFTIPAVLTDHAVTSGISAIVQGRAHPFGVLSAFTARRRSFTQDDAHFLQAVANVVATAVQRKRLEEEGARHSKELATRVLQAQEEERKRIARELHDETAQSLSMLLTNLDLLEPHIPPENGALRSGFERVGALAKRTLDSARALSHDLRPTILDDAGLAAALEWLSAEFEQENDCPVRIDALWEEPNGRYPELEMALFRIAQEALTNCGKHAKASLVRLRLRRQRDSVELTVRDDGRGFDPAVVPGPTREGRLGLYGMQERAVLLGGTLEVVTAPEMGTEIRVRLPLPRFEAAASKRGTTQARTR